MPKLREEPYYAIVFYMLLFVFTMHLTDRIDVIASCMMFREAMCFLKPLYRDCACMASDVHNGTHSSNVYGI